MKNSNVALTKCFFCGKNNEILLATKYNKKGEPTVDMSKFHGKVVSHEPCNECKEYMKAGIIIIEIRDGETDMENPYRTGNFFVIKEEAVKRILEPNKQLIEQVIKKRVIFIEQTPCKELGININ